MVRQASRAASDRQCRPGGFLRPLKRGGDTMGAYKAVALLLASATLISCSDGLTSVATPGGGGPAALELGAGGNGSTDPGEPVVVSSGIVIGPTPITGETDVALLKVDVTPASASLMFGGQQQ